MEPVLPLSCNRTHPGSERVQFIRPVSANRESGQTREEIVSSEEEGRREGEGTESAVCQRQENGEPCLSLNDRMG